MYLYAFTKTDSSSRLNYSVDSFLTRFLLFYVLLLRTISEKKKITKISFFQHHPALLAPEKTNDIYHNTCHGSHSKACGISCKMTAIQYHIHLSAFSSTAGLC